MRRILFSLSLAALVFSQQLAAQTDLLDPDTGIDDLFAAPPSEEVPAPDDPETGAANEPETEPEPEAAVEDEAAPLVDIVRGSSVSLSGDFLFNIGYTAGYTSVPWIPGSGSGGTGGTGSGESGSFSGFSQGALTDTKSALSLNFRIAPVFRVFLTFKFQFPTFKSEISEFFADYSFKDVVYMRAGRQTITWGISRYHPFTNLTARLPESYVDHDDPGDDSINDADSYSLKLNIPLGAGGFELLGFTRFGFMKDPYSPGASEIGWGGTYNLAIPAFDLTVGSFYQQQLNWRSYVSLGTTLFGKVDTYTEGVISYNLSHIPTPEEPEALTYGANIGFLYGFLEQRLQLSGEYYYTTESVDLVVKDNEYPLISGHNIAGGLSFYIPDAKLRLYSRVNYNVNENTGIVIPGLSWNALPFFTLTAAVPVFFGDPEGTYINSGPEENQDRRASLVIMVVLNGNF